MTTLLAGTEALALRPDSPEFRTSVRRMAELYQLEIRKLRAAYAGVDGISRRLAEIFTTPDDTRIYGFDLKITHSGDRYADLDQMIERMKRTAWSLLLRRLGIRRLMSIKDQERLDRQLETGEGLPEITGQAILDLLGGMVEQADEFATKAAKEVFELLRPNNNRYATNSAFRVGKRVVLEWYVEERYNGGGFRIRYQRQAHLNAIEGVFRLLDGRGTPKGEIDELATAIENNSVGVGATPYFEFRCFKKGTLHLRFKRLDLVKELNYLGAGERVLGDED